MRCQKFKPATMRAVFVSSISFFRSVILDVSSSSIKCTNIECTPTNKRTPYLTQNKCLHALYIFFSCSFFSSTWELYRCVLWRCIGCITSFHIYDKITTAFRWLGGGGVERSKVKENGKVLLLCINHRGDTDDYHMRTLAVDCSYTTYAHIYD